jgi:hypothetical protein
MGHLLSAVNHTTVQQFLKSEIPLTNQTLGFLPGKFIQQLAANYSFRSKSRIIFNQVTDFPQNRDFVASNIEMKSIDFFRQHPAETGILKQIRWRGSDFLHYSHPVRTEKVCLNCHGSKSTKTAHVALEQYVAGGNYPEGSIRGVQNFYLPYDNLFFEYGEQVFKRLLRNLLLFTGAFLLCVIVVVKFWPEVEDRRAG